ncbi:hypothetical protein HELRODRAFT_189909 [Helobdella robusta]|uniref:Plexin cytoplasmic RasGAP domain-containing protein n=1 Tax=Helobdella robusta TaxID=6412 RepID=T1FRH1_HELRO|nr:hypothetical protein HELRODRAFT_189909 [Helobdella robusta]ESN90595.1 hypothetical protein HELRODRAFT_189909 [Helobdella robusta]
MFFTANNHFSVIKSLLTEHVEKYLNERGQSKMVMMGTGGVANMLLTNWFAMLLYAPIKHTVGSSFYKLFLAIKYQIKRGPVDDVTGQSLYSLNADWLINRRIEFKTLTLVVLGPDIQLKERRLLRVLDCDTVDQVKEKILDALYCNLPYSNRPRKDCLDLEWHTSSKVRIRLSDNATSKSFNNLQHANNTSYNSIYNINNNNFNYLPTLSYYRVADMSVMALVPKISNQNFHCCLEEKLSNNKNKNNFSNNNNTNNFYRCNSNNANINNNNTHISPTTILNNITSNNNINKISNNVINNINNNNKEKSRHNIQKGCLNDACNNFSIIQHDNNDKTINTITTTTNNNNNNSNNNNNNSRRTDNDQNNRLTPRHLVSNYSDDRSKTLLTASRLTDHDNEFISAVCTTKKVLESYIFDLFEVIFSVQYRTPNTSNTVDTHQIYRSQQTNSIAASPAPKTPAAYHAQFNRTAFQQQCNTTDRKSLTNNNQQHHHQQQQNQQLNLSLLMAPIKFIFDFLDEQALQYGVDDTKVVNAWKSNSLPLRIWLSLIKNVDRLFDVKLTPSVKRNLSAVAQIFRDCCSSDVRKLTKDSKFSELLFAREVKKFKRVVEHYYESVKKLPSLSHHELLSDISECISEHADSFNMERALLELYHFVEDLSVELMQSLNENEMAHKSNLSFHLSQLCLSMSII